MEGMDPWLLARWNPQFSEFVLELFTRQPIEHENDYLGRVYVAFHHQVSYPANHRRRLA